MFLGRAGVLGWLLDALALTVATTWKQVVENVADGVAAGLGGFCGCADGVVASDAVRHGEGNAVRVDADAGACS
ncbi:hypothetical protein [Streptosporangium roseum]|uniref:hypothetical protein n=1 Tax=Streptosporangium roseum TaxID=2001 RepID=UPI0012DCF4FD|nr:hypothetical protein [Streptosporangium roseum]